MFELCNDRKQNLKIQTFIKLLTGVIQKSVDQLYYWLQYLASLVFK